MNQEELKQRTKAFAVRIVRLVEALPPTTVGRTFANQIVRSGTSVAANYRAACRSRSKAEFAAKLGIVIEEADETAFWLEMIIEAGIVPKDRIDSLLQEANELVAIFVSSRKTVSSSLKSNHKSSIDNRRS
ncbi:MAG: four helix bundle protein [Smithella sp.]|jgi:four helix bundle protein|nr:four helix bundle protein [Smithella sp.]